MAARLAPVGYSDGLLVALTLARRA